METESLEYIIESYINGQKKQARSLLREYRNENQTMGADIVECSHLFGIETCVLILKKLDISDTNIINAFFDNQREHLDEVKGILMYNY